MKQCDFCGTTENVREFPPTDEEPNHKPVFCHTHFFSDEVQGNEPISDEEKQQMWDDAK